MHATGGINVEIEQIVIGSGAEYLYRLIVDLLGRDKVYAIESPSYQKIEQVYRAAGVRYEMLPLCNDGIDGAALAKTDADVLHTTPYRSFPTGVTASASKRYEYIRWSEKGERFIIESDYDSEFSVSSKPTETIFPFPITITLFISIRFQKQFLRPCVSDIWFFPKACRAVQ